MSDLNRKLVSIPPGNMDVDSLISWCGQQFATSAGLFEEAEQYCKDLKHHHKHLAELMGMLQELKKNNPPREEIEEVVDTASEVIEAIKALQENRFGLDEQGKDLDSIEDEFVATEVGKTAADELQSDVERFMKNYNTLKAKLGLMTQQEVAKLTGIDRRYISIIESGKHRPQFKTLKRLADAFGVELDQLIN